MKHKLDPVNLTINETRSHVVLRRQLVETNLEERLFALLKASSTLVSSCTFCLVNVHHNSKLKNNVEKINLQYSCFSTLKKRFVHSFRPCQMLAFITWIPLQFSPKDPGLLFEGNVRVDALFLCFFLH